MTARPIPEDELERLARDHLGYELHQMALGAHRMVPENDRYVGNTVLEAFLVHVRVLDDFLKKPKPHYEDVLTTDYCPEWFPLPVR